MQIIYVSERNEAQSEKQKIKFRKNGFANMVKNLRKIALLALNQVCLN